MKKRVDKKLLIRILFFVLVFTALVYFVNLSVQEGVLSKDFEGFFENLKRQFKKGFLAPESVSVQEVIDSAYNTSNYMEGVRKVPESVRVGGKDLTPEEYLGVIVDSAQEMLANPNLDKKNTFVQIRTLNTLTNYYPNVDLLSLSNENLYSTLLKESDYQSLLNNLKSDLDSSSVKNVISFNGGDIRFPEYLFFASSLLRYHKFFNKMPESYSLYVISPEGLVPWPDPPEGFERYTSAITIKNTEVSRLRSRYYTYGPHYYEVFKQAKEIVGAETNKFYAAQDIYDWSKAEGWLNVGGWQGGYFPGTKPLSGNPSTDEVMRNRIGTSGIPYFYNIAFLRALNIPSTSDKVYTSGSTTGDWYNTDNHGSFGYVVSPPDPEPEYYPDVNEGFVKNIKDLISTSGNYPSRRLFYINPLDVYEHGAVKIVQDAKKGGFTGIVLNVKSTLGELHFSTSDSRGSSGDALGLLVVEAKKHGIKVYAGMSTLGDLYAIDNNLDWKQPPDKYRQGPAELVSPCVEEYKQMLKGHISEINSNYDIDGFLFGYLYFYTVLSDGEDVSKDNIACGAFNDGSSDWKERVLTKYFSDLTQTVLSGCPDCESYVLSHVIRYKTGVSRSLTEWQWMGHQNLFELNKVGNGTIMPFQGSQWLMQSGYHIPHVAGPVFSSSGKYPGVGIYFSDEWPFNSDFYEGVMKYSKNEGPDVFMLFGYNSMGGRYGPAFREAQYSRISEMETGSCSGGTEICDGIDNDCDGEIDENNGDCSGGSPYCIEGQCAPCSGDASCQDGLYCNGAEKCTSNGCVSGIAVSCDDGIHCTEGSCSEGSDLTDDEGQCEYLTDQCTCSDDDLCDKDMDNVNNSFDPNPDYNFECGDSDLDGCDDCSVEGKKNTMNDGTDVDGDGICEVNDCDDNDYYVELPEPEICNDGFDNDCDGEKDWDSQYWLGDEPFVADGVHGDDDCAVGVNSISTSIVGPYTKNATIDIQCNVSVAMVNSVFAYFDENSDGKYSLGDRACTTNKVEEGNKTVFQNCNVGGLGSKYIGCGIGDSSEEPFDRSYQKGSDKLISISVTDSCGNCGEIICDSSLNLEGSCSNECANDQCQICEPVCSCKEGFLDLDSDASNGCEYKSEQDDTGDGSDSGSNGGGTTNPQVENPQTELPASNETDEGNETKALRKIKVGRNTSYFRLEEGERAALELEGGFSYIAEFSLRDESSFLKISGEEYEIGESIGRIQLDGGDIYFARTELDSSSAVIAFSMDESSIREEVLGTGKNKTAKFVLIGSVLIIIAAVIFYIISRFKTSKKKEEFLRVFGKS